MTKTAILVDGGFYRKRAASLWGKKTAQDRADELHDYAFKHIARKTDGPYERELYRIFYYDCPPVQNVVYHPLLKKNIEFGKEETYKWTLDFFDALKRKRKVALRMGRLSDINPHFILNPEKVKKLCSGAVTIDDLQEQDFKISFMQKGVDMMMGVDISSLAAKAARRKGIDFILDPMGHGISKDLFEHIDGLEYFIDRDPQRKK